MPRNVTRAPFAGVSTKASSESATSGLSEMSASASLMRAAAGDLRDEVFEQVFEHGETIFHAAGRAGQVDDHGVASRAREATTERGLWHEREAASADRL